MGVEFIMLSIEVRDIPILKVSKLVSSLALLQQSFPEMDFFLIYRDGQHVRL